MLTKQQLRILSVFKRRESIGMLEHHPENLRKEIYMNNIILGVAETKAYRGRYTVSLLMPRSERFK
jgi:hypothetical protein